MISDSGITTIVARSSPSSTGRPTSPQSYQPAAATAAAAASTTSRPAMTRSRMDRARIIFYTWKLNQWISTAALFLVPALIGYLVPPTCRVFHLEDYSINYPYTHKEMFPNYSLALIVIFPVIFVYFPVTFFWCGTSRYRARELNAWALTQAMAAAICLAMINTTKVMGGRLRPDFVDRLRIEGLVAQSPNYPPVWNAGFSESSVCEHKWLQDNSRLRDGHLSFPSGHSGTSFAAMVPLCFFLVSRLRPFRTESLLRFTICLCPLILAYVVALSRTSDYRHNYDDIVAGGLIGAISGAMVVALHFTYVPQLGIWALKVPTHRFDSFVINSQQPANTSAVGHLDGHLESAAAGDMRHAVVNIMPVHHSPSVFAGNINSARNNNSNTNVLAREAEDVRSGHSNQPLSDGGVVVSSSPVTGGGVGAGTSTVVPVHEYSVSSSADHINPQGVSAGAPYVGPDARRIHYFTTDQSKDPFFRPNSVVVPGAATASLLRP